MGTKVFDKVFNYCGIDLKFMGTIYEREDGDIEIGVDKIFHKGENIISLLDDTMDFVEDFLMEKLGYSDGK